MNFLGRLQLHENKAFSTHVMILLDILENKHEKIQLILPID